MAGKGLKKKALLLVKVREPLFYGKKRKSESSGGKFRRRLDVVLNE